MPHASLYQVTHIFWYLPSSAEKQLVFQEHFHVPNVTYCHFSSPQELNNQNCRGGHFIVFQLRHKNPKSWAQKFKEQVCSNLKIKVSQEAVTKGSLNLINKKKPTGIRVFSLYHYYRNTLLTALSKKLHQLPEEMTGTSPHSLFMHFNLGDMNIHHGV